MTKSMDVKCRPLAVKHETYHTVAKTIDLADAELGTNEDHSFNIGILWKNTLFMAPLLPSQFDLH
jgi:hypothetical protein